MIVSPPYEKEILRDVFVPVSLMHRERISTALQAPGPNGVMTMMILREA